MSWGIERLILGICFECCLYCGKMESWKEIEKKEICILKSSFEFHLMWNL